MHIISVCVCGCRLIYPVYKAHAPYFFVICGLSGYNICHERHDYLKKEMDVKCEF